MTDNIIEVIVDPNPVVVEVVVDPSPVVVEVSTGIPGPRGYQGDAATIEVGETTTGEPGTNASVANVGNSSEAVFDFTIPRGDVGEQGERGTGITAGDGAPIIAGIAGDLYVDAETGDLYQFS